MPGPNINQRAAERLNQQTQERTRGTYRSYALNGEAVQITMNEKRTGFVQQRLERMDRFLARQENPTAAQNQLRALANLETQELSGENVLHGLLASHEVACQLDTLKTERENAGQKLTREEKTLLKDAKDIRKRFSDSLPNGKGLFGIELKDRYGGEEHVVVRGFEEEYRRKIAAEIATNLTAISPERRLQLREEVFMKNLKEHGDTQLDTLMKEVEAEETQQREIDVRKTQERDYHQKHTEKETLETYLDEHKGEYEEAKDKLSTAEQKRDSLQTQKETLQEQIDELTWEQDQINMPDSVSNLQTELDRAISTREGAQKKLDRLQAELDKVATQIQDEKDKQIGAFYPEKEREHIDELEKERIEHSAKAKEAKAKYEATKLELSKNPPIDRKTILYDELKDLAGTEAKETAEAEGLSAQIRTAEAVYKAKSENKGILPASTMVTFRTEQESRKREIASQTEKVTKATQEETKAKGKLSDAKELQEEKDSKEAEKNKKKHEIDKIDDQLLDVNEEITNLRNLTGIVRTYETKQRELAGVEKSIDSLAKLLGMTPDQMAEKLPEAALTRDGINQAFGVDIDISQYRNALAERGILARTPLSDTEISSHLKSMDNFSLWQFLIRILGGGEAYQI